MISGFCPESSLCSLLFDHWIDSLCAAANDVLKVSCLARPWDGFTARTFISVSRLNMQSHVFRAPPERQIYRVHHQESQMLFGDAAKAKCASRCVSTTFWRFILDINGILRHPKPWGHIKHNDDHPSDLFPLFKNFLLPSHNLWNPLYLLVLKTERTFIHSLCFHILCGVDILLKSIQSRNPAAAPPHPVHCGASLWFKGVSLIKPLR